MQCGRIVSRNWVVSMRPQLSFQRQVATIALKASSSLGFVLAGGSALREHGMTDRPTEDVDLFTNNADPADFSSAVMSVREALKHAGISSEVRRQFETFASMQLESAEGDSVVLEMGLDWRAKAEGVMLAIGPVLHRDDAVANKVLAVLGRALPRDFLDLDAIIGSSDYSIERIFELATHADPGFNAKYFLVALRAISGITAQRVERYGVSEDEWLGITRRVESFAQEVERLYRAE